MWGNAGSDQAVVPLAPLPTQFHDIWHRGETVSPERALALAVLGAAVEDVEKHRFAKRRRDQRLYWAAYGWITSDDREWHFSFVNLCEAVGLTVPAVRWQLLGEMMPPPVFSREASATSPPMLGKAA